MHRLKLFRAQRDHFDRLGALTISASGQEVLLGLTPEESEFFAHCSATAPHAITAADHHRYGALVIKHERARLHSLSFAAAPKNEASQG